MTSTSRRSFGINESALDPNNNTPSSLPGSEQRRILGRISFNQGHHKPSFTSRWRRSQDEEDGVGPAAPGRPPIPSALEPKGDLYSTPLPVLSMIVLSITMLGEFLTANVSTPFMLFMVKGFGELTDEADIAFWTGILVASFFLTQFLTSLLWATIAAKHGQRIVLYVALLGSAVTCLVFGTSTSLQQAITIRLLQGIFAGAVGVARGCVTVVTDVSNEGRAYAILGFCWGFGGVAGAIIGGTFESPALKWPDTFDSIPIFVKYPYILPCAMAAAITFVGSLLSLFLARDAGPREGAIRLPEKVEIGHPTIPEEEPISPGALVDEPEPHGIVGSLRKKISKRLSGYFNQGDAHAASSPIAVPLSPSVSRPRAFSRNSRNDGSAYGYNGSYRRRLASSTTRRGSNASSMRRRSSTVDGPLSLTETGDLNFAQRLLMANENAVTNIADLWVAAAMNADNEDPFESDSEVGSDADIPESDHEMPEVDDLPVTPTRPGRMSGRLVSNPHKRSSLGSPFAGSPRRPSTSQIPPSPIRHTSSSFVPGDSPSLRRYSNAMPTIFSHSGVRTPPAILDAQQMTVRSEEPAGGDALAPIIEGRRTSDSHRSTLSSETIVEKPPSLTSQLPILIIIQYGLLALHSTTHDQVFLSYLVSDYESGGLNLNAGHFAQLIALMCLAQIVYQFYLYPNIGPPRGRFSHLAMFRLGSLLFIPAYLTVVMYRVFANSTEDGNFFLMAALALSTAVRYCGNTFAYTSVSILLNYMTPPHAVGLANGVAQSIVSLARCFGPVLGGYLWAVSTQDNPSGYPVGFFVCSGVAAAAILHSFTIR